MTDSNTYLTPREAANLLMLSVDGLRKWADSGELRSLTTPGGHRRYLPVDIHDFALRKGIDLSLPEGKQLRVLLVDDDTLLLETLEDALTYFDDSVIIDSAVNGFGAGQKVSSFNPDIILLDERMPSIDGIEVCRKLKADSTTAHIRIIGMTGYPIPKIIEGMISAGCEACFSKPLNMPKLIDQMGLQQQGRVAC